MQESNRSQNSPFAYKAGELFCEDVSFAEIAREFNPPCYIYSYARIVQNYRTFEDAFSPIPHLIAYAVKANSNGAILRALAQQGCGADVVSGGELALALRAGIPSQRIVFAGVGKQKQELKHAIESQILSINVESVGELDLLHQIASAIKIPARIAIRINPNIDPKTHPFITTGRATDKFGIAAADAVDAFRYASKHPELHVIGVHLHLGSQITELSPYQAALDILFSLVENLAGEGIRLQYLDIGGGLGISYTGEPVPGPIDLASAIVPRVQGWEGTLILEPGRSIVGDAGALMTKVLYRKPGPLRPFLIVDAGMNDFIRPCLYQAQHRVTPVICDERKTEAVDVVGPVCESADVLARECLLPEVKPGEYLAIRDVGAYGFSMASTYNCRPRPAEVMVKGKEAFLIRQREKMDDLTARECIPPFLR